MFSGEKKLRNCTSEDRISSLPDDLIHLILSNMDAIDVIQTCLVSTRWRHVWRSVTQLNFHGCRFSIFSKFTKFVSRFLSNRCQKSHISVFNLDTAYIRQSKYVISESGYSFGRTIQHSLVKKIARHTRFAQKLNLASKFSFCQTDGVPLSLFNSSSTKELRLISSNLIVTNSNLDGSCWNLQALTTLVCDGVTFMSYPNNSDGKSMDYFSNLLNLRHLTLASCRTANSNHINITSLRLETLTISVSFTREPQGVNPGLFVVSAPKLSSFNYHDIYSDIAHSISSSDGFPCLERANISIYPCISTQKVMKDFIFGLFHKISNAMSLTLNKRTIFILSGFPELLHNQISPFCNLKLLKIVKDKGWRKGPSVPCHAIITYLCNSSPSVTIIDESENC